MDNDEELLRTMIDIYFEESPPKLADLQQAIMAGTWIELGRLLMR